jgi:hypothetical protein
VASTIHPLADHDEGRGAAAGEVVALADVIEEEEEDEEEEAKVVVEAEVADDDDEDEDLDADADTELDDEELAEAEGMVAPAGPTKTDILFAPPQV